MPVQLSDDQKTKLKEKIIRGELAFQDPEVKALILQKYQDDPLLFAQKFLDEHLLNKATKTQNPSPPFHKEIMDLYQTRNRIVIAAPRGHAKSTLTGLFYLLHVILFEKKKNVVIVSATEDMAKKFLRRAKDELEANQAILFTFGPQRTEKWSETEFRITNGAVVHAIGKGGQIRGFIEGANRPDLIILDDIEDDEQVRSQTRRLDLSDWFMAAVIPTAEPVTGQIILIGTVLHEDSLLNNVLNPDLYPQFVRKTYRALDENNNALWPERMSTKDLLELKDAYIKAGKLHKFYMEYQNDPMPAESATFKQEYLQYFNELPQSQNLPSTNDPSLIFETYIDLGGGSVKHGSDPTAMVTIAIDRHNNIYVHDYVNTRFGTDTHAMIQAMFQIYHKYRPQKFVIEKTVATNMLKATLEQEMLKTGIHLNIELVNPTKGSADKHAGMSDGKFQRIASMEAAFKLGVIKIRPWMTELIDQLLSFPRATHDDLVDALAYAYQGATRRFNLSKQQEQELEELEYKPLYAELGI